MILREIFELEAKRDSQPGGLAWMDQWRLEDMRAANAKLQEQREQNITPRREAAERVQKAFDDMFPASAEQGDVAAPAPAETRQRPPTGYERFLPTTQEVRQSWPVRAGASVVRLLSGRPKRRTATGLAEPLLPGQEGDVEAPSSFEDRWSARQHNIAVRLLEDGKLPFALEDYEERHLLSEDGVRDLMVPVLAKRLAIALGRRADSDDEDGTPAPPPYDNADLLQVMFEQTWLEQQDNTRRYALYTIGALLCHFVTSGEWWFIKVRMSF